MKDLTLARQERDEEPSDPPVPVDEWMDRLEFGVSQGALDQYDPFQKIKMLWDEVSQTVFRPQFNN